MATVISTAQAENILDCIDQGQKIAAIKELRNTPGISLGLREAKDIIDVVPPQGASRLDQHNVLMDALNRRDIAVVPDWAVTQIRASEGVVNVLLRILAAIEEQTEVLRDIKFTMED